MNLLQCIYSAENSELNEVICSDLLFISQDKTVLRPYFQLLKIFKRSKK